MRIETTGALGGEAGRSAPVVIELRDIFGVRVAAATAEDAVRAIDQRLSAGLSVKLAFLNAHTSNLAVRDDAFRQILREFLVLNDGLGLAIAARLVARRPFPQNLNGTDFVPFLLASSEHRFRLFLLGARPGIAQAASRRLMELAPRHEIAGVRHGYFRPEDAEAVASEVRASGADALLVALGNPAQERFIAAEADAAGVRLAIGVGALFDFLAGAVPRAPRALRRAGLEWAFRLAIEPRRMWRRYLLGNPRFIARVVAARLTARPAASSGEHRS